MAEIKKSTLNGIPVFEVTPTTGDQIINLATADTYVDKNIVVRIPQGSGGDFLLQTKTATPSEAIQNIIPDSGYALSKVTVEAIDSNYVGSGIPRRTSADLSSAGATVSVPSGYYESPASKSIGTGLEGTPIATKSEVVNHSIDITPSVTNTAGYITGTTKEGDAVTVTAADLVSGSQEITTNTTTDVTNLKEVVTAVPPLIINLTATVPTSGQNTISFTGLPSMPRAWTLDILGSTQNVTWNNIYRCVSARYDGTKTYTYTAYKGNQGSANPYIYMVDNGNGFTQTYSNGTLTFTTNNQGSQTYCGPFLARTYVLMAVCDNDGVPEIYRGS